MKHVVIIGAGFAGINAAKKLGGIDNIHVTLFDKKNHYLFQPLLYQVATAGLSPAEIAVPVRSLLSKHQNVRVIQEEVKSVDIKRKKITTSFGELAYDYLMIACGSQHSYFGHEEWEEWAPGLKTLEQATEIRRRILSAFEEAEKETDPEVKKKYLTFVIVGGGPTGVELAGAISEVSRFTLTKDFRSIDLKATRIILLEAGPRILPTFLEKEVKHVVLALKKLGVEIKTSSKVIQINKNGVSIGKEEIQAATVLWAAGVQASKLAQQLGVDLDNQGRVFVEPDLSLKNNKEVFVAGDLAHVKGVDGKALPGLAPVALQQGKFIAQNISREIKGKKRKPFHYFDKGQMATVGRSKAIVQIGKLNFTGFFAWIIWVFVHIYYLAGFKNRLFVILEWAWSYFKFSRGARLIVSKEWRLYPYKNSKSSEFSE